MPHLPAPATSQAAVICTCPVTALPDLGGGARGGGGGGGGGVGGGGVGGWEGVDWGWIWELEMGGGLGDGVVTWGGGLGGEGVVSGGRWCCVVGSAWVYWCWFSVTGGVNDVWSVAPGGWVFLLLFGRKVGVRIGLWGWNC